MPNHIIVMDSIPLTNNGKVDRKALPVPSRSRVAVEANKLVAPRTEMEKGVAEIWSAILNLPEIGVHDNFFELGGHSLLAVQIVIRINQAFDVEMALGTLFQMPTIAELANGIAAMQYVEESETLLDEVNADEQESFVF